MSHWCCRTIHRRRDRGICVLAAVSAAGLVAGSVGAAAAAALRPVLRSLLRFEQAPRRRRREPRAGAGVRAEAWVSSNCGVTAVCAKAPAHGRGCPTGSTTHSSWRGWSRSSGTCPNDRGRRRSSDILHPNMPKACCDSAPADHQLASNRIASRDEQSSLSASRSAGRAVQGASHRVAEGASSIRCTALRAEGTRSRAWISPSRTATKSTLSQVNSSPS